ncbi:MAG: DEAD/DEAH box helicase, partial [Lacunisphaera sp.]|nr:DEAD/DEAH box helicase [Lacunisphaera sp.]
MIALGDWRPRLTRDAGLQCSQRDPIPTPYFFMLRKLISKIRQTFVKDDQRSETKPAHKSGRPVPKSGEHRHDKRPTAHPARSIGSARSNPPPHREANSSRPAPVAARAPHVAKPLPEVPKLDTVFTQLGLSDRIAFAVQGMGYEVPTPIQAQAIPIILSGRDVIGSAQTGTGKTAAFALPILHRLQQHGKMRCLILEPTRELAVQVQEAFKNFSKYTDLRATVVYGGVGYGKQREDLAHGVDILAATPGRLLDYMEQGEIRLDNIDILVLDEVDRMLDMGFLPDVKRIVA